jgi:hypothetical protein
MSERKALQSWKEIADYLNRGVRTVQRWEQGFGLPVHRPAGRDRSSVLALPEELDDWMLQCPKKLPQDWSELEKEVSRLRAENEALASELSHLKSMVDKTQAMHAA